MDVANRHFPSGPMGGAFPSPRCQNWLHHPGKTTGTVTLWISTARPDRIEMRLDVWRTSNLPRRSPERGPHRHRMEGPDAGGTRLLYKPSRRPVIGKAGARLGHLPLEHRYGRFPDHCCFTGPGGPIWGSFRPMTRLKFTQEHRFRHAIRKGCGSHQLCFGVIGSSSRTLSLELLRWETSPIRPRDEPFAAPSHASTRTSTNGRPLSRRTRTSSGLVESTMWVPASRVLSTNGQRSGPIGTAKSIPTSVKFPLDSGIPRARSSLRISSLKL